MSEKFDEGYAIGYANAVHDKKDMIRVACDWLFFHLPITMDYYDDGLHINANANKFIEKFRKAMEEKL